MKDNLEQLLLEKLRGLQMNIQRRVVEGMAESSGVDEMSAIAAHGQDDTIYAIDRLGEEVILDYVKKEIMPHATCILIAEGLEEPAIFTHSGLEDDAQVRIIIDPIDGSRGLMYGKRSAWSLAAAAPNFGSQTTIDQIFVAVQTELPPAKQRLADQLWATEHGDMGAVRYNLDTGASSPMKFAPSRAKDVEHGFVTFCRFFPGVKDIISEIEEELARKLKGYEWPSLYFEDQYICTSGQLYELIAGHDRFICDLRAILADHMRERGDLRPLCCHPYDVCTELIARKAGVIVTPPGGKRLSCPLDTTTDVSWIGYANEDLYDLIGPRLTSILQKKKLLR